MSAPGAPAPADPVTVATAFVAVLRRTGLVVPVDATATYAAALDAVDVADPAQVYWAGRTTLVRRAEDVPAHDEAFVAFFGGRVPTRAPEPEPEVVTLATDDPDAEPEGGEDVADGGPTIEVRFSRTETLRHADLAALDDDELAEAHALLDRLRLAGSPRRSRRQVPVAGGGGRLDLGRTVDRALRTGGEALVPARTGPGVRLRRVVLLLDVSGSMAAYSRALLRFAHAAVVARRRVEAFALGTRLTRLTRDLSGRDPDAALARASAAVADWGGGTRLGDAIGAFNDTWGVRGMARGADVVILSDGWDRGDPARIDEEMARLARVAHSVTWVNPLKATPGYAPLARGMAAALPHVDRFVEGHSIASLEDLAGVLRGDGQAPAPTARGATR